MKNLEESDGADDVYILHVKRYDIMTCSGLGMWYGIWWCVYTACQDNCI
jgi:hypothetical protein